MIFLKNFKSIVFSIKFYIFWYIGLRGSTTCSGQKVSPKWKLLIFAPIFCTKSAVLNNFLKGHHVESFLKYFLCSLKYFRQKIWSKIGGPLGYWRCQSCLTQIANFQFWELCLTICIPFDRARKTEQLLWRYFGSSYNGMCGTMGWSGHRHENTIIFKNS